MDRAAGSSHTEEDQLPPRGLQCQGQSARSKDDKPDHLEGSLRSRLSSDPARMSKDGVSFQTARQGTDPNLKRACSPSAMPTNDMSPANCEDSNDDNACAEAEKVCSYYLLC